MHRFFYPHAQCVSAELFFQALSASRPGAVKICQSGDPLHPALLGVSNKTHLATAACSNHRPTMAKERNRSHKSAACWCVGGGLGELERNGPGFNFFPRSSLSSLSSSRFSVSLSLTQLRRHEEDLFWVIRHVQSRELKVIRAYTRSLLQASAATPGQLPGKSDDDCKRAQSGPMYTISRRRLRCDNRGGAAVPRS